MFTSMRFGLRLCHGPVSVGHSLLKFCEFICKDKSDRIIVSDCFFRDSNLAYYLPVNMNNGVIDEDICGKGVSSVVFGCQQKPGTVKEASPRKYEHPLDSPEQKRSHRRKPKSCSRSTDKMKERCSRRREKRHRPSSKSPSRSSSSSSGSGSRDRRRKRREERERRSEDDRRHGGNESYKYQEPNSTIMVRGLKFHLGEADIQEEISKTGLIPKEVRVIRDRDTGQPRGFAFVDFHTEIDAVRWMEMKKGVLVLHGRYWSNLVYSSTSKFPEFGGATEWKCDSCQGLNFKRRAICYRCQTPRPANEPTHSQSPTCTLVLKNLDVLTTEDTILQTIQSRTNLAAVPIKGVKIMRDPTTKMSFGICYVQTHSVADASDLYSGFNMDSLEIDGRKVSVDYGSEADMTKALNISNVAAEALAASNWTNNAPPKVETFGFYGEPSVETLAQGSARMYARTMDEYTSYVEFYRSYYKEQKTKGVAGSTHSNVDFGYWPNQYLASDPISSANQAQAMITPAISDVSTVPMPTYNENVSKPVNQSTEKTKTMNGSRHTLNPNRLTKEIDKWMKDSQKNQQKQKQLSNSDTVPSANSMKTGLSEKVRIAPNVALKVTLSTQVDDQLTSSQDTSSLIDGDSLNCLLCKRRFRSKDVLFKHVQLSDMHKRNLDVFLAQKKSKTMC